MMIFSHNSEDLNLENSINEEIIQKKLSDEAEDWNIGSSKDNNNSFSINNTNNENEVNESGRKRRVTKRSGYWDQVEEIIIEDPTIGKNFIRVRCKFCKEVISGSNGLKKKIQPVERHLDVTCPVKHQNSNTCNIKKARKNRSSIIENRNVIPKGIFLSSTIFLLF
jgi:hypothetical protein